MFHIITYQINNYSEQKGDSNIDCMRRAVMEGLRWWCIPQPFPQQGPSLNLLLSRGKLVFLN